jgi:hypothetical protein
MSYSLVHKMVLRQSHSYFVKIYDYTRKNDNVHSVEERGFFRKLYRKICCPYCVSHSGFRVIVCTHEGILCCWLHEWNSLSAYQVLTIPCLNMQIV